MTGELNEQQINNLLCSQAIGRVACCDDKYPYIVPVTYVFDGEFIHCQSSEGKKIDLMRTNPNVCFEVDLCNSISNWQSVIVYGQFEEQTGDGKAKTREALTSKVLSLSTASEIHHHEHEEATGHVIIDDGRVKPITFRIRINEKSGRFEKI